MFNCCVVVKDHNDVAAQNTHFFFLSFLSLVCSLFKLCHVVTQQYSLHVACDTIPCPCFFFFLMFILCISHCLFFLCAIFFWGSATCLIFSSSSSCLIPELIHSSLFKREVRIHKLTVLIFSSAFFFASHPLRCQ